MKRQFPFLFFVSLLLSTRLLAGGFDWRLSGETGYFHAKSNPSLNSLSALTGSLGYRSGTAGQTWSIQLRVRPELFDADNRMISASAGALYKRTWSDWQLAGLLGARQQSYLLEDADLTVRSFQVQGVLTFTGGHWVWVETEGRRLWGSSEAESRNELVSNTGFLRGRVFYSKRGSISAGGFSERFYANTNDVLTVPDANRGWRNGLEFRLDYTKSVVVNLQYLVSWRTSRWTRGRSTEHEINLVFGRNFGSRWSVFVLADYTIRKLNRSNQVTRNLLYTNSNYDNRIYVKGGYDINSTQNVFLKVSYLRNELIQEQTRLSGTQVAIGYEIRH